MTEIDKAPLRNHGVVIEILLKVFPEFHRLLIEGFVSWQHVIGSNDCRIAADTARTKPAFFQDGDIIDAKFLGQVMGSRQTMTAAANYNDIVDLFRFGVAPMRLPPCVAS